jgi:hypothetical protein
MLRRYFSLSALSQTQVLISYVTGNFDQTDALAGTLRVSARVVLMGVSLLRSDRRLLLNF